jgi:ABC-type uncharacterized transport system fused permease/ATPase subunit
MTCREKEIYESLPAEEQVKLKKQLLFLNIVFVTALSLIGLGYFLAMVFEVQCLHWLLEPIAKGGN